MTTVDLSTADKQGAAAGMTQVYNYGDVNGSDFTITQYVEPDDGTNFRTPFQNGTTGGFTQYSAGPRNDTSETLGYYRVRLVSTLPLDSITWAARGISGTTGEDISYVSNSGTTSGLSNSTTGTVNWPSLPENTYEVHFVVVSSSDGNNSGYGRPDTGSAVISTGSGGGGGETYIRPGTVTAQGTATSPGVWDTFVPVTDSNGSVGTVPLRIIVEPGDPPVLTSPSNQTNDVGDVISLQLSSTNPNSHTLVYSAGNLPAPLQIDEGTGLITGTLTTSGSYEVELVVKDEWGQCSTVFIDWDVSGQDTTNLDDITGPVVIGRYTGTGPQLALEPLTARETISTYSKTQIDSKDSTTLATVRGGIIDDYDTLEKLRIHLESLLELNGGGGDVDLSGLYSILGISINDTQMPAVGAISAGSVADQIEDLEARIPDNTAALPDMPGETMLVRALTSTGPPSNKTYAEIRSLLSLYTQAEIGAFLANKFDDSKGDDLVTLTGVNVNSENLGSFSGNTIASDKTIKGALQDLETKVEAVENGQGSGVSISGETIAANFETTSGEITGKTAEQVRAFLNVYEKPETYSQAEVDAEVTTAISNLIASAPSSLNTLNELAAAIGDDPDFSTTITNLIAAKAAQTTVASLITLSGMGTGATNYGDFDGETLGSDLAAKPLFQVIENRLEAISNGSLNVPTWSQFTLQSAHTARNWQVTVDCYVRRGAAGDVCFLKGEVTRSTGSGGTDTFLENTRLFTAALASDLRPTFDFKFAINGSGSSGTRNRMGQLIVKADTGHIEFQGDQSQSTYIWDFYGSWPVGGGLIA